MQKLEFLNNNFFDPVVMDSNITPYISLLELSKNDGLSLEDLKSWFKPYDLSKPMVIIHFGKFRY